MGLFGVHLGDLRHLVAEVALDAVAERGRRARAAAAGTVQADGDDPLLGNVHELEVAAVGLHHGTQLLDDFLDVFSHSQIPEGQDVAVLAMRAPVAGGTRKWLPQPAWDKRNTGKYGSSDEPSTAACELRKRNWRSRDAGRAKRRRPFAKCARAAA